MTRISDYANTPGTTVPGYKDIAPTGLSFREAVCCKKMSDIKGIIKQGG
jgi:hypothetical protein